MEVDLNEKIIGDNEDHENPVYELNRVRHTSKMIAYNDAGKFAVLEFSGKDEYNHIREHLEIPGGKIESDETPEEAVIREAIWGSTFTPEI